MEAQSPYQPVASEQVVIRIMRKLPPERISMLIDFARFLEFQASERYQDWIEDEPDDAERKGAGDEEWNKLLAQPEAKRLMLEMAHDARAAYRTGQTTDITETEDGRLTPG